MNDVPIWAQIIIAVLGSGTIGGIAGAFASAITSRQKIKELEVLHNQKMLENYRSSVNPYLETLYIPINVKISKIVNESHRFNKGLQLNEEQAESDFRLSCEKFVTQMFELYEEGTDVYLNQDVDDKLRDFTFYIRSALDGTLQKYTIASDDFYDKFNELANEVKVSIRKTILGIDVIIPE